MPMKKFFPNLDDEEWLETVLEVPIPEEIFSINNGTTRANWQKTINSWMKKPNAESKSSSSGGRNTQIQLLLGVIGAPLVPSAITTAENQPFIRTIKDHQIEASMAKYIVKQYVAAAGGEKALNWVESMHAMGEVRIGGTEPVSSSGNKKTKKKLPMKGEIGGFVVWQKRPELWCLEMVISGYKISAGSDGKVGWRQTPVRHHSHASRPQPTTLGRLLQGLDPRSTGNLFTNSICIGEKTVNKEDCFILKLELESCSLQPRCSSNIEIIRHTVWGYFSQRTGLLVQLEDCHLLKLKTSGTDYIYWEISTESLIQDYRTVDGIQIAHAGKTLVSLLRYGEGPESQLRTIMEEVWQIKEVEFNIKGLSMECFLPPSDLKGEEVKLEDAECGDLVASNAKLPCKIPSASNFRIGASKVAAINVDDSRTSQKGENM